MKCILVADDDPALRELIHDSLEVLGHEMLIVDNGEEVLRKLEERLPDLILLDIQIPAIDGISLVRQIRNSPRWAGLKIVALSAFAMRGDDQKALDAGFDAYLKKPIGVAELRKQVQQLLQSNQ